MATSTLAQAQTPEQAQRISELFGDVATAQAAQHDARQVWREAVSAVAAKAEAALPQSNGRIAKAVALVLNGDVELLPDGHAQVGSQTDGATEYQVVNGTCGCKDFPQAPDGWCKHRLSAAIQKRATALVNTRLDALPVVEPTPAPVSPGQAGGAAACPEAMFSITLKGTSGGHEVLLTTRGQSWDEFCANVRRLNGMLDAPPAPVVHQPSRPASPAAPARDEWCSVHETAMRWHEGSPKGWYSHPTDDARFSTGHCKGRVPKQAKR